MVKDPELERLEALLAEINADSGTDSEPEEPTFNNDGTPIVNDTENDTTSTKAQKLESPNTMSSSKSPSLVISESQKPKNSSKKADHEISLSKVANKDPQNIEVMEVAQKSDVLLAEDEQFANDPLNDARKQPVADDLIKVTTELDSDVSSHYSDSDSNDESPAKGKPIATSSSKESEPESIMSTMAIKTLQTSTDKTHQLHEVEPEKIKLDADTMATKSDTGSMNNLSDANNRTNTMLTGSDLQELEVLRSKADKTPEPKITIETFSKSGYSDQIQSGNVMTSKTVPEKEGSSRVESDEVGITNAKHSLAAQSKHLKNAEESLEATKLTKESESAKKIRNLAPVPQIKTMFSSEDILSTKDSSPSSDMQSSGSANEVQNAINQSKNDLKEHSSLQDAEDLNGADKFRKGIEESELHPLNNRKKSFQESKSSSVENVNTESLQEFDASDKKNTIEEIGSDDGSLAIDPKENFINVSQSEKVTHKSKDNSQSVEKVVLDETITPSVSELQAKTQQAAGQDTLVKGPDFRTEASARRKEAKVTDPKAEGFNKTSGTNELGGNLQKEEFNPEVTVADTRESENQKEGETTEEPEIVKEPETIKEPEIATQLNVTSSKCDNEPSADHEAQEVQDADKIPRADAVSENDKAATKRVSCSSSKPELEPKPPGVKESTLLTEIPVTDVKQDGSDEAENVEGTIAKSLTNLIENNVPKPGTKTKSGSQSSVPSSSTPVPLEASKSDVENLVFDNLNSPIVTQAVTERASSIVPLAEPAATKGSTSKSLDPSINPESVKTPVAPVDKSIFTESSASLVAVEKLTVEDKPETDTRYNSELSRKIEATGEINLKTHPDSKNGSEPYFSEVTANPSDSQSLSEKDYPESADKITATIAPIVVNTAKSNNLGPNPEVATTEFNSTSLDKGDTKILTANASQSKKPPLSLKPAQKVPEPSKHDENTVYLYMSMASGVRGSMSRFNRASTILKSYDIEFVPVEITLDESAKRRWKYKGVANNKALPAVFRDGDLKCDFNELVEANEIEDVEDLIFDGL